MHSMSTNDKALRDHVIYLLEEGGAHAKFDDVVKDWPVKLRGQKVENLPYTAWGLLEHMRIAQNDILDFSLNPKYKGMNWPADYWPKTDAPPTPDAWDTSVRAFKKDLAAISTLVRDPKTDLYAKIPWGDGQTILREALLTADHNAYHLGQLLTLRRVLGAWKD
jgi:hypothetical protein